MLRRFFLSAAAALPLLFAAGCSDDPVLLSASGPEQKPGPAPEPEPTFDPDYFSTDFSADGETVVLQRAEEGRGIDLVLMGDAYTDRMVANGVYMRKMNEMMEAFFSEEPCRSFRRLFNVYAVKAVSKHEVVAEGKETALGVSFGEGTVIDGDYQAVAEYVLRVPEMQNDPERMNDLVVLVLVNQIRWAGTCHPWGPVSVWDGETLLEGDYGRGFSITYSTYIDADDLTYTVVHEAAGHGFAKLADEYYYEEESRISDEEIEAVRWYQPYGYWRNLDFSGDETKCLWYKYMTDPRYADADLGYYEGGYYYARGVWRSSQQSLMLYTEGGFNPISRELIYRRIHKLAYGDGWQFDYETFAAYDARNRKARLHTLGRPLPDRRPPLPRPQFIRRDGPLLRR